MAAPSSIPSGPEQVAGTEFQKADQPPIWIRVCLVFHVLVVTLALTTNMASSEVQRDLLWLASPYLKSLYWNMNLVPIELTHGNELDGPFSIQVHRAADPEDRWLSFDTLQPDPSPVEATKSRDLWSGRFAQRTAFLLAEDDHAPLTRVLTSVIQSCESKAESADIDQIRIVRWLVPNRSEFRSAPREARALMRQPEVLFGAQVVSLDSKELMLVPTIESHRSSKAGAGKPPMAPEAIGP
jgi:hypothetical protein